MSFTTPWDESAPPGSAAANTIDNIIRNLKRDLRERLDEILGEAGVFDDDPIIDGTILKSIKTIVTELDSKTTLSGLSNGRLIKATGAAAIGNSTITETQLSNLIGMHQTVEADSKSFGGTGVVWDLSTTLPAGTWLMMFRAATPSHEIEINNTAGFGIFRNTYGAVLGMVESNPAIPIPLQLVTYDSGGDYSYKAVRLLL